MGGGVRSFKQGTEQGGVGLEGGGREESVLLREVYWLNGGEGGETRERSQYH